MANREGSQIQGMRAQRNWWRAVLRRDSGFDGRFVFGVRSTGVYCRPSCPSRRPRRERVVFFEHPEEAQQAGYRACRRCQPDRPGAAGRQAELVERTCRLIEANLEEPLPLVRLSAGVGVSPFHLQRIFKRVMGITPRQYADAQRLSSFKARLRQGQGVTRALYDAGYGSSSRLYERAPTRLGMTPATYRRGGQGMRIAYTVVASPLGRLLVARTERGICAINLGNSERALEAELRREFPAADLHRDRNGLNKWVRVLLQHLAGRQRELDLPLDVQGTAFQCRVWESLRRIPFGRTRSYAQIARAVGQPGAARAVGHACATNPVPLVIPCHRVVRGNGALGGYRLGLERKRVLLELEKARAETKG